MYKYAVIFLFSILSIPTNAQWHKVNAGVEAADTVTLSAVPDALPKKIPRGQELCLEEVDLKDLMPPVGDQGKQNSCGAWALGYACRSYYNLQDDEEYRKAKRPNYTKIISPNFIYNMLNHGNNEPISLLSALQLLSDTGACSWRAWKMWKRLPLSLSPYKQKPGERQMAEARNFRISNFNRVNEKNLLEEIKHQLSGGIPVIIEARYDPDFLKDGFFGLLERKRSQQIPYVWDTTNYAPVSAEHGKLMCHALVITGYSDSLQAFKFINSYGTHWGNKGFGWLSYNLTNRAITTAYVITPKEKPKSLIAKEDANAVVETGKKKCCKCSCKRKKPEPDDNKSDTTSADQEEHVNNTFTIKIETTTQTYSDSFDITVSTTVADCLCDSFQIVVQFFFADANNNTIKGDPVQAYYPPYRLTNGQAAVVGEKQDFAGDKKYSEILRIPLNQMALKKGINKLIAEAVLFNDDYPLKAYDNVPIEVNY